MDFINEGKTGKVKLQDIFDNIYEDCDFVLADDFYKGLKPKMNQKKNIDLADAEVQLYIRDFLESHENDYQYDLLKQALEPYYDHAYDLADEDVQESYEVLEEDEYLDENATFEEIIYRMECAEIYEDLYNAAMLIVDPKLQNEVTKLIQQCEDDGDEVEEAYSIVTSDLLDMHINDKNVENLNEDKKIKTEEYEPNIGSSSYDLGIDFNSYLEENDNVCSLLDYVKFTLATLEADLGPSGLDSFEEVPDFDEILDNIKQDIGQGDITIDDWNKEEAEDYFNDWLDDLNLEESKKIKIEAEDKESLEDIANKCIKCDVDYIKEVIEEEGSKKSFIERAMEDPCDFGWDSIIPDEYYEDKRLYALIYDLVVKKENKKESDEIDKSKKIKTEVKKTLDDVYSDSATESLWDEKFNELVPEEGKANTDIGEIMRCFASMSHAYLQNGEIIQNMQRSYLEDVIDLDKVLKRFGDQTLITLLDKMDLTRSKSAYDHYMAEFYEYFVNTYLKDNKEIKEESEENSQEFDYRLLSRLKSDCDYYLGNGNRNAEHCLWAKNEDDQIAKMREIYNQLKEKPEWLSEEDINNYAKEMGVIDLPSTTDGTAEKEIQDMLDRSEKRSKEGLTESTEDKFSGTEFEKNIPHVMRFKEYDVKENDGVKTLYWVTQQFFTLEELEEFQNAFIELTSDKMNFKDAYVTVRDLSHYDLDKDYEDGVLCYVTAQSIDYEGYEDACEEYKFDLHKGWLDESKKITEAEDMEEVKDEVTDAAEKSNATDLEKEQVAGSIEVLKTDEESAIEGYEDFNEETSKVVDKELADAVEEQMEEIIEDEKEHIEKLDTIKDALDEAKGVAPDFKVDFEGDMTLNMGYTDKEGAKKRAEELIDDVAKSSNIKELNVDVKNVEEIEEDKKEEFLDANINVDTGDISPNLDLGGLGALAGLVASEEKKDSDKKLTENTVVWTSEYEGDEETAEEAYQEYLDEFESSAKTPKSFEMWLEDTKEVWFEAEAERYKEENPDKDLDKLTDFELDEINAELYDRVEKEIEANMDDLKEQYEEYCEEIKQEMTSPLDKEKWLTGWYEQDAQAQWEVKDEDFSNSVWPMIESQCKEDILILLGSVGRWDGTSGGGKIIYADEKNLRDTMADYDEIRVEADDNNQISINYIHHDGTDSMYLYTIPEDLTELAKVMGYDDPDELDTDIRQDYVDMEELSKHVDKLTPIIYKGGNE